MKSETPFLRFLPPAACLLLLATLPSSLAPAASPGTQDTLIAQRFDYTGIFKDGTPVTKWNEWKIKEGVVGKDYPWEGPKGDITHFEVAKDGSAIVATADGQCLAVDFSGASGADAMLVLAGAPAAAEPARAAADGPPSIGRKKKGKKGNAKSNAPSVAQLETATVTSGGTSFSLTFLTQGEAPQPEEVGDKLEVDKQNISLKDGIIVLGKWAGE